MNPHACSALRTEAEVGEGSEPRSPTLCKSAGFGQSHPGGRVSHLADRRQGARVRHSGDSNDSEPPPYSMEVQQRCYTATPSRFLRNTPNLDSDTDDLGLRVVRDE
jgi:hypothetical protein